MEENEFQCDKCGEIFEKGWSDVDALEESVNMWGDRILEKLTVVCDPCFKKMART